VTQAADPDHRNQVARHRAAVPQRVVCGDSGAKQRCCFRGVQSLGYGHQRLHGSQQVLPVSPVIADAWDLQIPAIAKIAAPARGTRIVLAAVPADPGALSHLPCRNARAEIVDDTRHFMARNTRILNSGPFSLFGQLIAVTDAACLYPDAHLPGGGLGNLAVDDLEIPSGAENLRHPHGCGGSFYTRHDTLPWAYLFEVHLHSHPLAMTPQTDSVSNRTIQRNSAASSPFHRSW